MPERVSECLICRRMDYKESSRLVFGYTPTGRQSYLAQGANKLTSPLRVATETLTKVRITHAGKGMQIIRDIEVLDDYPEIKPDLERYTACLHLLELTLHVSEGDLDHAKLYRFLDKILDRLKTNEHHLVYIMVFESKLLYLLGLQPAFNHCHACPATDNLVFSIKEGGMCCPNHAPQGKVLTAETVDDWRHLHYFDLASGSPKAFSATELRALRLALDDYYQYHLGWESHARKLLRGLLGY